MQKCKMHNVDFEDFCILCAAEEQKSSKTWLIWIAVVVVLMVLGLIYGLVFFSE